MHGFVLGGTHRRPGLHVDCGLWAGHPALGQQQHQNGEPRVLRCHDGGVEVFRDDACALEERRPVGGL